MKPTGLDRLSPARRRLILAGFLVVSVFSSLGHGGGDPVQLLKDVVNPEEPGCADNTLKVWVAGDGQTGIAGAPLPQLLSFGLSCLSKRDRRVINVQQADVAWEVSSGGGLVNGSVNTSLFTDYYGNLKANWQLGPVVGTQTLVARSSGVSFSFSATGTPPVAGGTCTDNVTTTGTNFSSLRETQGDETWTLAGSPYRVGSVSVRAGALTVEAGVQVCFDDIVVNQGARLLARGTAAAPVHIDPKDSASHGISLELADAVTGGLSSELLHTEIHGLADLTTVDHPLRIEDSQFSNGGAWRRQPGCSGISFSNRWTAVAPTTVLRSTFDGFGSATAGCEKAAVTLDERLAPKGGNSKFSARVSNSPGIGVSVAATTSGDKSWQIEDCEITHSGNTGLLLSANVPYVRGCSFTNNGLDILNFMPGLFTVLAKGNWWDPASGGVSAGVDASEALTAPPVLGY